METQVERGWGFPPLQRLTPCGILTCWTRREIFFVFFLLICVEIWNFIIHGKSRQGTRGQTSYLCNLNFKCVISGCWWIKASESLVRTMFSAKPKPRCSNMYYSFTQCRNCCEQSYDRQGFLVVQFSRVFFIFRKFLTCEALEGQFCLCYDWFFDRFLNCVISYF